MAFLFGRNRQRSAQDLVKTTKDLLQKLVREEASSGKVGLPCNTVGCRPPQLTLDTAGRRARP